MRCRSGTAGMQEGVFVQAVPDSDVGRRFPEGGFLIEPLFPAR